MNAKQILAKLIHFNTSSDLSNLGLLEWVKNYLCQHNVSFWSIANESGEKENLFATIGPNIDGGIVLSAHTDVVPVEGQDWQTDPFTLVEKDDNLYGRGTCDMKGFLSSALALVPYMQTLHLSRPIHLALTYDEELGCLGVPLLIKEMNSRVPSVDTVIVCNQRFTSQPKSAGYFPSFSAV